MTKILEAISYFLAGTFMLQLLRDQNMLARFSEQTKISIRYIGSVFLIIGVISAVFSLPVFSQFRFIRTGRHYLKKYSIFPLFLVTLSAVVVTGIPESIPLTLALFYIVFVSFVWLSSKDIARSFEIQFKSLAGAGKTLAFAGFSLLWFRFVGWWSNIDLPYELGILIIGGISFVVGFSLLIVHLIIKSSKKLSGEGKIRGAWLRQLARNEINRRRPPIALSEKLGLNVPSWKTILGIAIMLALSILFSAILSAVAPGLLFIKTADSLKEFYLTMWQVQGAIAAFALPLSIVAIEFSRDLRQAAARRPEALIRGTWVFPIIAFALMGTVRLGIDLSLFLEESVFWFDFVIVFMGTICLTIIAYTRMLLILLSPLKMQKSSMISIRSQMDKQLDITIEQRIANNMLLKRLQELGLDLWPFSPNPDEEEQYLILRSQVSGIICDIDLGRLELFVNRLPWLKTENPSVLGSADELDKGKSLREKAPKQYVWWMKQYGKLITNQNNGLVRLDKSKFDISNPADLEAQLSKLITTSKEEKGNELRLELSYIRDSLMYSIRDCKTGAVQEGLKVYEELITTFLDKLQQWKATYKKEQAIRESTSLGGGWGEVRWISHDLHEIIDMAMRVEYTSILQEVLHFPISLASLAFLRGDYYIFHQFLDWVPYYYNLALKMKGVAAKEFVIGRCSIYPAESLRYYIIPNIERSPTEVEIEDGGDFARGIILVFNRLLKSAYDNKEVEHFKAFSATIHSVFDSYFRHNQEHEVASLEFQLRNSTLTDAQKSKLERQLSMKKKHVWVMKRLVETIKTMHYGLHAWVLHEYNADKIGADNFKQWHEMFPRPDNLESCWNAFYLALKQEDKDDYGWSFWQSIEQSPSYAFAGVTTFWGGFDTYLRMLFCIQCLRTIGNMTVEQQESAAMPHSSEIISLAESESSPLREVLKQIEQNKPKWQAIVEESGIKAIPMFRRILDNAIQVQREENNNLIKKATLSSQRVNLVKQEIIDTWKKNTQFREIVCQFGEYEFVDKPSEGEKFFGFNQLQPKDIYVDGTNVAVEGWGSQFGRDLASGEDEAFVEVVLNNLESLGEADVEQEPTLTLTKALDRLRKAEYSPVVLILNSWVSFATIEKSELFKKAENQSGHGFVGYFLNRPVFNLHYQGDPCIIMVDLKKFCTWRQFKPIQLFPGEEYLTSEMTFFVKPFSEESAKTAVQQNQKLLLAKDGSQRPEAEVISELQLQVHFRLLEQYKFEIKDKASGYKISTQH